jgi:hypothetical protein
MKTKLKDLLFIIIASMLGVAGLVTYSIEGAAVVLYALVIIRLLITVIEAFRQSIRNKHKVLL